MQSKEQYELRIKWIEDNINLYNGYKQDAIIQRFNELRNELKEEIKDLDLTMTYDSFWNELNFSSITLGLDRDNFISFTRSYLYRENFIFKELIDLIEKYYIYFEELYKGSYNPSYKIL